MTTSLASSLDHLSLTSSTTTTWASDSPSDEDEIVWSLSSSALLSTSPPLHSPLSETMDFVLVPRATAVAAAAALSASPAADTIAEEMAALSLTPTAHARASADPAASPSSPTRTTVKRATIRKAKKRAASGQHQAAATTAEQQQQQQQPAPLAASKKKGKKAKKRARGSSSSSSTASSASSIGLHGAAATSSPDARPSRIISPAGKSPAKRAGSSTGLGTRALVDDSVSEASEPSSSSVPSSTTAEYQEAQKFMTSCVTHINPSPSPIKAI